jgi:hypothetical protein
MMAAGDALDASDGDVSEVLRSIQELEGRVQDLEHVRLQQEEYDRIFAEEERLVSRSRRGHVGRPGRQRAAEDAPSMMVVEDPRETLGALMEAVAVDSAGEEGDATQQARPQLAARRGHLSGRAFARALAHVGREEAMSPFVLGDEDEEVFGMHALLNMLIRSQDEADLQDAMRRSSEEAYSGGFSVPPVDEAVLQRMTTTSEFCSTDPKGQCSVCLMDFEPGDSLRTMQCNHRFHMACVDQWLAQSAQCPVCKKKVGS